MKKIVRLTENDLTKLVKSVINEQALQLLKGLFKKSVNLADDIVSKYGDDFASKLANALNKNVRTLDDGLVYVLSNSGSKVPLSQIESALNAIAKGKVSADEVANLLPRTLMDGSDFRNLILNSKPIGNIVTSVGKLHNFIPNQIVSNSSFVDDMINWSNVTNAKSMSDYNKTIASALKSGDYSRISRGGFEKYGIPNFRDFLQKSVNFDKKIMFSPENGQWYFQVK